ncbi:hypothetical protein NW762_013350 [Fusarium torreyae]|uniref:Uncharacterized protein n=1 Tax=Fusarium torreyae TaxID=1237075 RepID=A0A9W8RML9_9HYPO|nr:hypothetical protein NW762_013350 [Fusarium torreyae]
MVSIKTGSLPTGTNSGEKRAREDWLSASTSPVTTPAVLRGGFDDPDGVIQPAVDIEENATEMKTMKKMPLPVRGSRCTPLRSALP